MEKCKNVKQKPFRQIYAYSRKLRHNQAYSGIIQAFSEPCLTMAYSELWYIQNSDTFRTRDIFRILGYSEPWDIQN